MTLKNELASSFFFTHSPKASHEAAIHQICCCLQGTKDDGLILNPTSELNVDCHVDADFAGLFGVEDPADPISVKSRTGYVIMNANCPLLWVCKLQQEISLSTQESECVALSCSLRDVIPIQNLVKDIVLAVGLDVDKLTFVTKSTVFEDNNAALTLATTKKITPQNRHIGAKCHWFQSHVGDTIKIEKMDTDKQVADCLTKNLEAHKFVLACKMMCGW